MIIYYDRIGPMEVESNIVAQLHSQLVPDLENSDDSASDEEEDEPRSHKFRRNTDKADTMKILLESM